MAKAELLESKDNFGRFVAEPLEKGLGVTLGTAMRRVLLGNLLGAAVTRVKIEGSSMSSLQYLMLKKMLSSFCSTSKRSELSQFQVDLVS